MVPEEGRWETEDGKRAAPEDAGCRGTRRRANGGRGHLRVPPSRTAETQGFRATEDKASLQIKCKQKPQPQGCLKSRILKTNNI